MTLPLRLALPLLLLAAAAHAEPAPYDGVWGATAKACRDPEGVHQLGIKGGDFAWYETYCKTLSSRPGPGRGWTLRLACTGEGHRFTARPRLVLSSPDRLIMYDAPVEPVKRQTYVRCANSKRSGRPPRYGRAALARPNAVE